MAIADIRIETERLLLRLPRAEDFDRYAALHEDAEATRYIGGCLPRAAAWRKFLQMPGAWMVQGYGMFSVVEKSSGAWIGQLGPWRPEGWPGNEIGWVFMREAWGRGYATEAGRAAIDWAFATLGWDEVIHSIHPDNAPSQALARRLGSHLRGPCRLPPPYADAPSQCWAQTREEWLARQPPACWPTRYISQNSDAMPTVYGLRASGNCYKVQWLLGMLNRPCRWIDTDSATGATRTPEFLALNPNGKVPLLVLADGRRLAESNAILCYLAEGTPYLPADAWQRALTLQWLFFEQYSHEPYIAVARFIRRWLPADHARQAEVPALIERGGRALDVMEQHLAAEAFFSGGAFGVADIALFAYTHCAAEGGFELSRWPRIGAWLERVRAQTGFIPMST